MTGFNVNCKDCLYCYLRSVRKGIPLYRCGVYCEPVDIENNIDCTEYEPKRADD